ncbi:hypothetical protein QJS10_CPB17g01400 [Acorus calamus]|uniref:Uncharacterized protein n=1 Tax=Acorus calamus TaxID=4465 RepID=A0AAV9CV43_ACOCL|nr:hypothetical protein QJS10_CPB17g01400 [Acorus calamus]
MASQSDPSTFSVRIVSIDYYMSPPIPDIDICYSHAYTEALSHAIEKALMDVKDEQKKIMVKFRDPQPSHYTGKFTYDSPSLQAESSGEASRGLLSLSPTVPSDPTTNGHDAFGNQTSHSVKRQSICELEGDSVLDGLCYLEGFV